jgi:hypothetical protein
LKEAAAMGKYEPLGEFLRAQTREQVPMTFKEIERILGARLPASKQHRAWWSNNSDNNVMTRAWLQAGYETEAVDVQAGKLVFRKMKDEPRPPSETSRHPMFGCMKDMFTVEEGYDLTSPMELEEGWDKKYEA